MATEPEDPERAAARERGLARWRAEQEAEKERRARAQEQWRRDEEERAARERQQDLARMNRENALLLAAPSEIPPMWSTLVLREVLLVSRIVERGVTKSEARLVRRKVDEYLARCEEDAAQVGHGGNLLQSAGGVILGGVLGGVFSAPLGMVVLLLCAGTALFTTWMVTELFNWLRKQRIVAVARAMRAISDKLDDAGHSDES